MPFSLSSALQQREPVDRLGITWACRVSLAIVGCRECRAEHLSSSAADFGFWTRKGCSRVYSSSLLGSREERTPENRSATHCEIFFTVCTLESSAVARDKVSSLCTSRSSCLPPTLHCCVGEGAKCTREKCRRSGRERESSHQNFKFCSISFFTFSGKGCTRFDGEENILKELEDS